MKKYLNPSINYTHRKRVLILLFLGLFPEIVYANVVWPALYAETKISFIPIILLSLFIEYWFYKWLFNIGYKKAVLYTAVANLVSGAMAIFTRPISYLFYALFVSLFTTLTFNPIALFSIPILGAIINAFIELVTIKLIWKEKITKKRFLLTSLINALTKGIVIIWAIIIFLQGI